MAPKRSKKREVNENVQNYDNLVFEDVLCPICRSILVEPVTLPCSHGFCLACFNGTMENNALVCPLCRIRIGSWVRTARKENKVINERLWNVIQNKFADQLKFRLDGEDEVPEEKVCVNLAEPGEIRQEYETELQKQRSEMAKQHEAEEKASEVAIQQIIDADTRMTRKSQEKLRKDEDFARWLASSSNSPEPGCSHTKDKVPMVSLIDNYLVPMNKKQEASQGKLLTPRMAYKREQATLNARARGTPKNCVTKVMCESRRRKSSNAFKNLLHTQTQQERPSSNRSDSGDSINQEMRYFKPIRTAPKSGSKLYHGNVVRAPLLKVPCVHPMPSWPSNIRAPHTDNVVRIKPHTGSAFVACSRSVSVSFVAAAVAGPSPPPSPTPTPLQMPPLLQPQSQLQPCLLQPLAQPPLLQPQPPLLQPQSSMLQPPLLQPLPPLLQPQSLSLPLPLPLPLPPMLQSQPPMLQSQPPLLQSQPPLLQSQPPLLQSQPPLLQSQPPLLQSQPPLLQSQPPLLHPQPCLLQPQPCMLQSMSQPPLLHPLAPLMHPLPPLLQPQPTPYSDLNQSLKQYYSKKKNAIHMATRSPTTCSSPWLGYSNDEQALGGVSLAGISPYSMEMMHGPSTSASATITAPATATSRTMSSVPRISTGIGRATGIGRPTGTSRAPATIVAPVPVATCSAPRAATPKDAMLKPPKKKLLERSLKKVNGCDNVSVCSSEVTMVVPPAPKPTPPPPPPPPPPLTPAEMRLQEQLDFEFAKRLHEELNNPRTRAFMTLKAASMQKRAKRQVTLDELIPPKKFKI